MSEIEGIINELKNIHDGNAWHGASLKDALDGIGYEQAALRPLNRVGGNEREVGNYAPMFFERRRKTTGFDFGRENRRQRLLVSFPFAKNA